MVDMDESGRALVATDRTSQQLGLGRRKPVDALDELGELLFGLATLRCSYLICASDAYPARTGSQFPAARPGGR
jgi:hypothetical protein